MIICRKRVACNAVRKNIQRIYQYDVVVAGSGPAGVCAAVSAARQGRNKAICPKAYSRPIYEAIASTTELVSEDESILYLFGDYMEYR